MYSPMPKSPAHDLSEKSKKYDRQIRLWGDHGQALLEGAQVCVINATALGTEILKGLVLPGIGGFTIVDGGIVTEEDIGVNFFLDPASLGQSRAKCAATLLQELNPDVNGDHIADPIETVLERNPAFLASFACVVATNIKETLLLQLSADLWTLNIPFVFCRSIGFFGSARLQLREHCIVETHPDNKPNDLRLDRPFPTLRAHLDASTLGAKQPWLVVLYKFLQQWSAQNDGRRPATYKEKSELRKMISGAMSKDEENYEEAIRAVNTSFGGGRPSADLQALFADDECVRLRKDSNKFWILTRAVKDFTEQRQPDDEENDGATAAVAADASAADVKDTATAAADVVAAVGAGSLPVSGLIPDMSASTTNYIKLQRVFRERAHADAARVYALVQHHLGVLGLPESMIGELETQHFCREVATLGIVRGTRIVDEYERQPELPQLAEQLDGPDSLAGHYVAMRAWDRFRLEHGCDAGEVHVEADTARMKAIAGKLLAEWGVAGGVALNDDLAHELCRCGGAEIHTVSAFLGGCVAHEVIKLITKQYRPIDNTYLYNAITSESAVYRL